MSEAPTETATPKRGGSSRTGWCMICDSSLKSEINRRLRIGQSANKIVAYAKGADFPVGADTVRRHKTHITDSMTTLVEQARRNPDIKRVGAEEHLATLVEIGQSRAISDPSQVTINHSLKAAQALVGRDTRVDIFMAIATLVTDRAEVIEGSYTEIKENES